MTDTPITCDSCGIIFMCPAKWVKSRRDDHKTFYCPNGHRLWFSGASEEEKLRAERDRLKQQTAQLQDEVGAAWAETDHERRRAAAARGQVTKIKKRVANGVCPCCSRSFVDLRRHMETKHAGFALDAQP